MMGRLRNILLKTLILKSNWLSKKDLPSLLSRSISQNEVEHSKVTGVVIDLEEISDATTTVNEIPSRKD